MLLKAQGKQSLAETFYRRALEGFERALGPDHPHTLGSASNLRVLLKACARARETPQYCSLIKKRSTVLFAKA